MNISMRREKAITCYGNKRANRLQMLRSSKKRGKVIRLMRSEINKQPSKRRVINHCIVSKATLHKTSTLSEIKGYYKSKLKNRKSIKFDHPL
jgi:hypothetical protein